MSLRKQFLQRVFPTIVTMWVFTLYTMMDGIFVGQGVGPVALGAVNIAMPFINSIFAVSMLFGAGTSTVIAILFGQGNEKEANQVFTLNACVVTVISLVVTIATMLNLRPIAAFLGATDSNIDYVVNYLKFVIPFVLCFMVSYIFEVLVNTDGFPKLATISISIGAVTNIVLDYLFVMVLHLGVEGAAFSTGFSQFISMTIFLVHFLGKKSRLKFVRFRLDFSVYKRIIPLGLSNAVTELSSGVTTFVFNHVILSVIGESGIVSFTIVTYVNSLALMTMFAVAQGSQPLVSFYHGSREPSKCHSLLKMGTVMVGFCSVLAFGVCQLFAGPIVSAFLSPSDTVLFTASVAALRIYSVCFLIMGFNVIASGFFGAIERPRSAMIISFGRGFVLIIIALIGMSWLFQDIGIWLAAAVSELLCLVVTAVIFLRYWNSLPKRREPILHTEETFG